MSAPDFTAIASGLCADCGLCCNGVMFYTVQLQAGDSAKALSALGLKLKRKQGQNYLLQPCPAFQPSGCSIYAARPQRCRLFECRQLQRVAAGQIPEAMARETIRETRRLVAEVEALLAQLGGTNPKRPLSRRSSKILSEPLPDPSDPAAVALRHQLVETVRRLDDRLNEDFRIVPKQLDEEPDPE